MTTKSPTASSVVPWWNFTSVLAPRSKVTVAADAPRVRIDIWLSESATTSPGTCLLRVLPGMSWIRSASPEGSSDTATTSPTRRSPRPASGRDGMRTSVSSPTVTSTSKPSEATTMTPSSTETMVPKKSRAWTCASSEDCASAGAEARAKAAMALATSTARVASNLRALLSNR